MRIGRANSYHAIRWLVVLAIVALLSPQLLSAQASNPVPFVTEPLVPMAAEPGGPGFTLTVNGAGFVPGSVVLWNGRARATTFISGARIVANIPASDIAVDGTSWVTVANPAPGGGVSNVSYFSSTSPSSSVSLVGTDLPVVPGANLIAGDFNNDGRLDFALASFNPLSLSVYLGNGDGTFKSAIVVPIPASSETDIVRLLVGDFNGDGNADISVGRSDIYRSSPQLLTFLGKGDGTFQPPVETSMPNGYYGPLIAEDFNGDGKLDLAGVMFTAISQSLTISPGNDDGTFQNPVSYAIDSGAPQAAVAGDFNGDGKLDVAVATTTEVSVIKGSVDVFLGNGDGTFHPSGVFGVGVNPTSSVTADLSQDGKADLATSDSSGNTVSILLGHGDGTFQTASTYGVGKAPNWMALADFNGDGKLDLVTANGDSGNISTLLGNGDGTFQAHSDYTVPAAPSGLIAGDLDGSGRMGLLVNLPSASTVSVLLQPLELLTVSIDIKPGDRTNTINLKSHGVVPVAILGSATFDPMTVDPSTVTFAGAPVATRGRGVLMTGQSDVNGDGYPDLVLYFRMQDLQLTSAPADHRSALQQVEAVLYGTTYSGQRIRGSDSVRIVPAVQNPSGGLQPRPGRRSLPQPK